MCFAKLPLSLIMPVSICLGFSLGIRLCEKRFDYLQGVVFTKNFWNFKAILNKNHFDVCLKQTCYEKFKQFSWIDKIAEVGLFFICSNSRKALTASMLIISAASEGNKTSPKMAKTII